MLFNFPRRRVAARLAWRDMTRHKARSIFATLLVALPIAALVAGLALLTGTPNSRQRALAAIPRNAQAVLTATAVLNTGQPFMQAPEGASLWVDSPSQQPASAANIAAITPDQDALLRYWDSETLIATAGGDLQPGDQIQVDAAGADTTDSSGADLDGAVRAKLRETEHDALPLLMPPVAQGAAPQDATQAVISASLAEQLHLNVGDTLTLTAPPFQGAYSTNGRIGAVLQNSRRAWRISGIADVTSTLDVWTYSGWLKGMVEADGGNGVDAHYLLVGSEPLTWTQVKRLNMLQVVAVSRHVLTDGYPSAEERYPRQIDVQQQLMRMVSVTVTAFLGIALTLFLITPAFAVSADQSRRLLGLTAACGADGVDLRRMMSFQGLFIGISGGMIGIIAGIGLSYAAAPALKGAYVHEVAGMIPWTMLPLAALAAVMIGLAATWMPAHRVSRMNVVDALKDRSDNGERNRRESRLYRVVTAISTAALLGAAVACAMGGLAMPMPEFGDADYGSLPAEAIGAQLLLIGAIVFSFAGLIQLIRLIAQLCERHGTLLPLAVRMGLRDAGEHHRRFVPAAAAIAVSVAVASYALTMTGSLIANDRSNAMEVVHGHSHAVVSPEVPIDNAVDRAVVRSALNAISDDLPVTAHQPVYALAEVPPETVDKLNVTEANELMRRFPNAAARLATPLDCITSSDPDRGQDVASAHNPNAQPYCVGASRSYRPLYRGLTMINADFSVLIMSGDAMRLSGFANADKAADMLDQGGVVVGNAATLRKDGTVDLEISHSAHNPDGSSAPDVVTGSASRPGVWVDGFFPLAMSKETAQSLGLTAFRYVGDMVQFTDAPGWSTLDKLRSIIDDRLPLVNGTSQSYRYSWGTGDPSSMLAELLPFALLMLLAIAATVISLLLARIQIIRDLATMHAVGASPGFLRRFTLAQAAIMLAAGTPTGMVTGLALGIFHVAWYRHIGYDGAWLDTVPCWDLQAALLIGVIAMGLGMAWLAARPSRKLVRRTLD